MVRINNAPREYSSISTEFFQPHLLTYVFITPKESAITTARISTSHQAIPQKTKGNNAKPQKNPCIQKLSLPLLNGILSQYIVKAPQDNPKTSKYAQICPVLAPSRLKVAIICSKLQPISLVLVLRRKSRKSPFLAIPPKRYANADRIERIINSKLIIC